MMHENIGPVDVQIPQATYLVMMPDGSVGQQTLMLDNSGSMEDQIKREVEMNPQLYDNTIFELPNGLMHVQDGQNVLMRGNVLDAMQDPAILALLRESTTKPVPKVMDQEELPADFGPVLLQDDEPTPIPVMMAPTSTGIPVLNQPTSTGIPVLNVQPTSTGIPILNQPTSTGIPVLNLGEPEVTSLHQAQRMGPAAESEFLMRYGSMGPKTGMVSDFDPEGSGYDYASAEAFGMEPDADGHFYSRVPQTGLLLKGASHPTFDKTLSAEAAVGNTVTQGPDGRYYSN